MLFELGPGYVIDLGDVLHAQQKSDGYLIFDTATFRVFVVQYVFDSDRQAEEYASHDEPSEDVTSRAQLTLGSIGEISIYAISSPTHIPYVQLYARLGSDVFVLSFEPIESARSTFDARYVASLVRESSAAVP